MKTDLGRLGPTIAVRRTDPIYNCHSYLTKVPIDAIVPFIEAFTDPGDTVVDFFAGSGMTGIAAVTLGRRALLSDISVLGRHIFEGYMTRTDPDELLQSANEVIGTAQAALPGVYQSVRQSDGDAVDFVRIIWSFTYICPSCAYRLVYFDHLTESSTRIEQCPCCSGSFRRSRWPRGEDVPVQVVIWDRGRRQASQAVSEFDRNKILEYSKDPRYLQVPSLRIGPEREMYSRSGLGKSGLTQTRDYFSPRNAISLLELWRSIEQIENDSIRRNLRFCFTAILPRASKRYQWSRKRPLNAQNQTYYVAPVYFEWNIFDLFKRKIHASIKAAKYMSERAKHFGVDLQKDVVYLNASADNLSHLKDECVDYVFTDPPFGSNIFYSDMSLFHEAWLGETTDHRSEAVVHTVGKRKVGSERRYELAIGSSFKEAWRILKPGGHMSVVFSNSRGSIWGIFQRALREGGFKSAPVHVAVLKKGQRSVKGLASGREAVVTADLVLTVRKEALSNWSDACSRSTSIEPQVLISEVLAETPPEDVRNPTDLYLRVLSKAIGHNHRLDDLHLSDVMMALRNSGYAIDEKTGNFAQGQFDLET